MNKSRAVLRLTGVALAALVSATLSFVPVTSPLTAPLSPRIAEAAPTNTNSSNSIYYRQTGHYIKDAFLNYWLMNGGVALYGYPISEETIQNDVAVQYFERARFEYHPESGRPWHVELTPAGNIIAQGRGFTTVTAAAAMNGRTFYEQTGHTLGGAFAQFWRNNGGLSIFGYPISEEMSENGVTVQYFERARFELLGQGRVQLGHVGAELMARHIEEGTLDPAVAAPNNRPGYQMSFRGNSTWYAPAAFGTTWERIINLNKSWGNLPQDFVGRGFYAAAPADLGLYGRMARVTHGNRSVFVQFVDVIAYGDIPYVRSRGIVIDLGKEVFQALGGPDAPRYEVTMDVFWPGEEP